MEQSVVTVDCKYGEPHKYPSDWKFGGADGKHPGADSRWSPTVYIYWSEDFDQIFVTSSPVCDDQAIDEFTKIAEIFPNEKPKYLSARRPGGKEEMLTLTYDRATDEVAERA